MKLEDIMEQNWWGRNRRIPNGSKSSDTYALSLEDPNTGKEHEAIIRRYFHYDNGDVGFGVGPGKSPYPATWEFDGAEVAQPFEWQGQRYQKGQDLDLDDFKPYLSKWQQESMYEPNSQDGSDIGDEDEGY